MKQNCVKFPTVIGLTTYIGPALTNITWRRQHLFTQWDKKLYEVSFYKIFL